MLYRNALSKSRGLFRYLPVGSGGFPRSLQEAAIYLPAGNCSILVARPVGQVLDSHVVVSATCDAFATWNSRHIGIECIHRYEHYGSYLSRVVV